VNEEGDELQHEGIFAEKGKERGIFMKNQPILNPKIILF